MYIPFLRMKLNFIEDKNIVGSGLFRLPFLAVEKRYGRRGAKPISQKISIKDNYIDINL